MQSKVNKVVILGGGTAGWMTAAALSKVLKSVEICLVESDHIGTIGVGEATIPTMQFFNGFLGIDPHDFIKKTRGTYKLAIKFENWSEIGAEYFNAFGKTGKSLWSTGFHDFWRKGKELGLSADFNAYNFEAVAAQNGKFGKSANGLNYAYHIDATSYAKMLRNLAEKQGVTRIEGKVESVQQVDGASDIQSLTLTTSQVIQGDLFIDCSGFAGLLIDKTLNSDFVDLSQWLPMDRAIAVQSTLTSEPKPYTRSIAHTAGWQWRIPLQHRMGNGIVYCSKYMQDEEAQKLLLDTIDGEPVTTPKVIKFKTGYRKQLWKNNCVAIGLAGGFIEPLESTAIHLIQQGILRLIKLFPSNGIEPLDRDEYNKSSEIDYNQIKDFIILHYSQTQRTDSPFWQFCHNMTLPESLQSRLELFKKAGRFIQREEELFADSWLQVMIGQNVIPQKYHRLVDELSGQQLAQFLSQTKQEIEAKVALLPSHQDYIDRHCKAID